MSLRRLLLLVLLAVVCVLFMTPLGTSAHASPDDGDATGRASAPLGIPRTYEDAVARFEEVTKPVVSVRKFLSPSGNIFCNLRVPNLPSGCEINEGSVRDPAVCSGNPVSKYVGRIEFQRGRAVPVCNTDTIRTPGARTLPYGQAARFRHFNIMCLSETIGVTCINLDKTEGFFLHRGEYVIFNAG